MINLLKVKKNGNHSGLAGENLCLLLLTYGTVTNIEKKDGLANRAAQAVV
jgi:hypothetical protein